MTAPPESTPYDIVHRRLTYVLQGVIAVGLAAEIYERQWLNVAVVAGILLLTIAPRFLSRGLNVYIPPEFELLTIAFIFAALFLGERRDYYERFWWWDLALHATSGGLLGVLGFLLVYLLNANPRVDLHMRSGFLALFAFCFSLSVGALWEIFEFAMDQAFGMNMQKPMFGDPSGLTDTMWDLIVDALGALAVSLYGYAYVNRGRSSLMERWIRRFIAGNPELFARVPRPDDARESDHG
jgi:hypothetical protein